MRLLLAFGILLFSCQSSTAPSGADELVFQSVHVIAMDKEGVMQSQDVVVRDGRIIAMGTTGELTYGSAATIVDARGKYLMPGLAEMHAHVPPVDDLEPMKEVLTLFLANGVTTIRGMLGHPRHLELREKIDSGEIMGPHFYTTGPSFNGNTVKTREEGVQRVRDQKAAGYDYLKLHPGLTPETFEAIATTAHEVGIPFAGHVSFAVGIDRAIEAGYSSIDHLDGFVEALVPGIEKMGEEASGLFGIYASAKADTNRIPALMTKLKEKNIWMVPTQALAERWMSPIAGAVFMDAPEMKYIKRETREVWAKAKKDLLENNRYNSEQAEAFIRLRRKIILECKKNGVGLLLGSDAPQIFNVPGFSAHHELKYLVDAGLTPYEALRTGTVNVGIYLGKADSGIIKTGAVSDLLLLEANPLDNIQNTQRIAGVMIGKRYIPADSIRVMLKALEKN